jgi:hypothetical protein
MYKNAMKCNKTRSKWCKNKHGASKIIETFEMYHLPRKEEGVTQTISGPEERKGSIKNKA